MVLVVLPAILALDTDENQASKALENLSKEQQQKAQEHVDNIKQQMRGKEDSADCKKLACEHWVSVTIHRCEEVYNDQATEWEVNAQCMGAMTFVERSCRACLCPEVRRTKKEKYLPFCM